MIFPRKNTGTGTGKFIGAYLPRQLVEDISLLALAKGVSKTEILQQCICTYLAKAFPDPSEIYLTIASNAYWQFAQDQSKGKQQRQYKNWASFAAKCRQELCLKKDISIKSVEEIMEALLTIRKNIQ